MIRLFRIITSSRSVVMVLLVVLLATTNEVRGDSAKTAGEAIYQRGVLSSGKPLKAVREAGGVVMEGADAACINCHRRSGLGSKEGRIFVPPITGRYLFHQRTSSIEDSDLPYVEGMRSDREPYTDETLARAIREGLDSGGKPLHYLMPQFNLNDADMAALIDYLKHHDKRKLPGVTDTMLHFATIITPDADPVKAHGMLDVLDHFFADKNSEPFGPTPRLRTSRKMMFMSHRRWQLHIWQLTGLPETWQEQLETHFSKEPVLAVVSGLSGKTWQPIQSFCETNSVPCIFPNVEVPPVDSDHNFYSLYFSKGILLEAELIANKILKSGTGKVSKVVQQIYRTGDNGEAGALELEKLLEHQGISVQSHALPSGTKSQFLESALKKVLSPDTLVLWLRPQDISALATMPPPPGPVTVFMSGLMGGLEQSQLPSSWRSQTHLTYPFAMPEQHQIGVDFALGWFTVRHIPIVATQIQADTYLACGLLSETLSHMVDAFVPDYLVERMEDDIERRIITGYYPHLSLAPGQRYASKGGYIAHFANQEGSKLVSEGGWTIPE